MRSWYIKDCLHKNKIKLDAKKFNVDFLVVPINYVLRKGCGL